MIHDFVSLVPVVSVARCVDGPLGKKTLRTVVRNCPRLQRGNEMMDDDVRTFQHFQRPAYQTAASYINDHCSL